MLLVPFLCLQRTSTRPSSRAVEVASSASAGVTGALDVRVAPVDGLESADVAAAAVSPPVPVAAPPPAAAATPAGHVTPTTVAHRSTTTTAPHRAAPAPAAKPAPAPSPAPQPAPSTSQSQQGDASWYDAPAGSCAHRTLPIGTIVKVTDLANGRSTTCRVSDRGPYGGGRIIDLSRSTFSQLADPSEGVIQVRIEW